MVKRAQQPQTQKRRRGLLYGVLLTAVALMLLAYSYYSFYQTSLEAAERSEQEYLITRQEHIRHRMSATQDVLVMLRTTLENMRTHDALDDAMVTAMQQRVLEEFTYIYGVSVLYDSDISAGGTYSHVWYDDTFVYVERQKMSEDTRTWYEDIKDRPRTVVSNPRYDPQNLNHAPFISVFLPIQEYGKFIGLLCADISLDYMQDLATPPGGRHGSMILVSSDGCVVASTKQDVPQLHSIFDMDKTWIATVTESLRGVASVSYIRDDMAYLLASSPFDVAQNQRWVLISMVPRRDILAGFNHSVTVQLALVGVVAISLYILWQVFRINRKSMTDALTGIGNRGWLDQMLPAALRRAAQSNKNVCLLMIDIDNFKTINDTYGHPMGDLVLKDLAGRLQRKIRSGSDWVARYGGEEFLVCLTDVPHHVVERIVGSMLEDIRSARVPAGNDEIKYTVSVGGAYNSEELKTAPQVLAAADKNLYAAKHAGKDQFVI